MFPPARKQHMSTAALCKGKQSRSVLRLCSGHARIIPPVSGSASSSSLALLFLCMDSAAEATVPSAQGLLKLRLGALKGTSGGRSENTSFEPLSPQGGLATSDDGAKVKVTAWSCRADRKAGRQLISMLFPQQLPPI